MLDSQYEKWEAPLKAWPQKTWQTVTWHWRHQWHQSSNIRHQSSSNIRFQTSEYLRYIDTTVKSACFPVLKLTSTAGSFLWMQDVAVSTCIFSGKESANPTQTARDWWVETGKSCLSNVQNAQNLAAFWLWFHCFSACGLDKVVRDAGWDERNTKCDVHCKPEGLQFWKLVHQRNDQTVKLTQTFSVMCDKVSSTFSIQEVLWTLPWWEILASLLWPAIPLNWHLPLF